MTTTHHHDHPNDRAHFWRARSSHVTSEGLVTYQSCTCGRWRILTGGHPEAVTRQR